MNFLIRSELWDYICGKNNSNFYDFQIKCFSKVAAGITLNESCDRILRAEGRDAGLGLAARRIATVLTKELKEQNVTLNDESYVAYRSDASLSIFLLADLNLKIILGRRLSKRGPGSKSKY